MKNFRALLASIILIGCFALDSNASHVSGGNITWECTGGNTYAIFLTLYRDCSGSTLGTTVGVSTTGTTPSFSSGTFSLTNSCGLTPTITSGTGLTQVSVTEVSQLCPADLPNSQCNGGTLPGMQEYVYTMTVTLPDCDCWTMSYTLCCRNSAITNIGAPGSDYSTIQSTLCNATGPSCNSGPDFTAQPIPYLCNNVPFCYDYGVVEADGNNLTYALTSALNSGSPSIYAAGFSATAPIAGITIDPASGQICFTPAIVGNFVVVVMVTETDGAGNVIGTYMQDIQFVIQNCVNEVPTPAATISGTTGSGSVTGGSSIQLCEGDNFCTDIVFTDLDAADVMTLTSNVAAVLPGATFTVSGTNPITATICWTENAGGPAFYSFAVDVIDDACPIPGINAFTIDVTVLDPTDPACVTCVMVADLLPEADQCLTGNSFDFDATGSTDPGSMGANVPDYIWDYGDGNGGTWSDGGAHTKTHSYAAAGTYTVTVTVTDGNGCIDVATITVNVIDITADLLPLAGQCLTGNSFNFDATGSTDPGSMGANVPDYIWDYGDGNGVTSSGSGAHTETHSYAAPGTYTVTVTVTDGNCPAVATITIEVFDEPVVTASGVDLLCNGGADGQVSASSAGGTPAITYAWDNGGVGSPVTGLGPGTYVVIATDANGCTGTDQVTITEPTALVGTLNSTSDATCGQANGSADVSASGGTTIYSYDIGTGPQATGVFTGLLPGGYTVTITDANGCTTAVPATILDLSGLTASITAQTDVSCFGLCDGSVTVTAGGSTAPYTYDIGAGPVGTGGFTGLCAGPYTVTVTDGNGCTFPVAVTITEPTALAGSITVQTDVTCFGLCDGTVTVLATGGTAPLSYDIGSGPQASGAFTGLCVGANDVTVTDANGCTFTIPVTIIEPVALGGSITAQVDVSCFGLCDGTVTVLATGGTAPLSYDIGSGPQATGVFTGLCAGANDVTVTDTNGCTFIVPVTTIEPTVLAGTLNSTIDATCGQANGFADVSASGGTGPYDYDIGTGTQTSGVFTGLTPGGYIVTITDLNGCTTTVPATINDLSGLSASITAQTDVSCFGLCDGSVTITAGGSAAPYTYDIGAGPVTSGTFTGLCAGPYTVITTDANGCTFPVAVTITEFTALGGSINLQTDISCFGVCDGEVTVVGTGGATPLSYDVGAGPQASGVFTGLCVGANDVTVTDANGCTFIVPVNITEPTPVGGSITLQVNVSCFGVCDGEVTLTGTGGTAPLSYDIGVGAQPTGDFTGLCAGANDVTVTDANGCSFVIPVTITEPTALIGTLNTTTDATCGAANGAADVSASGGAGPYDFDIGTGTQATGTFTGLLPGGYTVTIIDANGCTITVPVTILDLSGLTGSIAAQTDASCFGVCDGTVDITAGGSTGPYSFDIGAGPVATGTFAGLCAGPTTIIVTDANGCTFQVAVTILEPTALSSATTGTDALCNLGCDGTIDLSVAGGTAGYTYAWTGQGGPYTTEDLANLCAGTYDVTVTDANGCTGADSYVINEPTAITMNTNSNSSNCGQSDGSVGVTPAGGTSPFTYEWTDASGSVVSTSPIATNLPAGVYTIVVTDNNGCTASVPASISDIGGGSATASVTSNHNGQEISCAGECDGEITVVLTGGTAPFTYDFNGTSQAGNIAVNLCAGTYPITVTDSLGCSAAASVTITEPVALDVAVVIVDEVCVGDCLGSISLTASGGTPPYTYTFDNGVTYGAATNLSNLCAGNYDVGAKDANGCPFDVSVTIAVGANIADATIDAVSDFCVDDAAITLTAAQVGGTWSGNGITDPITGNFDPSIAGAGVHQVFYGIGGPCPDGDDVTITVFALPTISFIADDMDGCAPLTATLVNTTPGSASCAWDFGIGTENTCGPHTVLYNAPGSYDVSLTVTSTDGCVDTLVNPGMITVFENPIADFEFGPQPTTILDPTIDFTNTSYLGDSWEWYFSDLGISSLENPSYTFEQPGAYNTQLVVTTLDGCVDIVEYTVQILETTIVYVPNSFTPDGDGLNDLFFPLVSGIDETTYEFSIFDRWGELIFASHHKEIQWDGTVYGKLAKTDVYVWKLVVSGLEGEHIDYVGHVTLLR